MMEIVGEARHEALVAKRGKNNGRSDGMEDGDGERQLGSFQNNASAAHFHYITLNFDGGTPSYNVVNQPNYHMTRRAANRSYTDRDDYMISTSTGTPDSTATGMDRQPSSAGSENTALDTRPNNIVMNIFIKIN